MALLMFFALVALLGLPAIIGQGWPAVHRADGSSGCTCDYCTSSTGAAEPRIPASAGAVVVRHTSGRSIPLRALHSDRGSVSATGLMLLALLLLMLTMGGYFAYEYVVAVVDHVSAALTTGAGS